MSLPVAIAALALALAVAGCGGDDEQAATDARPGATTSDAAGSTTNGAEPEARPQPTGEQPGGRPPSSGAEEEVPGGPGDEIPASAPAAFAGRGGRVDPRVVRVPPFIGIGVSLRSIDGRPYSLVIGGRTLRVGGARKTDRARLDGLRPGKAYAGTVRGTGARVRIEPSAEPGP